MQFNRFFIRALATAITLFALPVATSLAAPDGFNCPPTSDNNTGAGGQFAGGMNALNTGAVATCSSSSGAAQIPVAGVINANTLVVNNETHGGREAVIVRIGSSATNVSVNGSAFIQHAEPNSPGYTTLQFNGTTGTAINATIQFDVGGNTFHFIINKALAGYTVDAFTIIAGPDPAAANNNGSATRQLISSFMQNRANHILANQPDLISFVDGSNGKTNALPGNLAINGNENSLEVAFATSHSQIRASLDGTGANQRIEQAFDKTENQHDNQQNNVSSAVSTYQQPSLAGTWDIWTRVNGAHSSFNAADSDFWLGSVGVHRFVTDQMLIGVLAQFDWADETNSALNAKVSGNGWMVGPYVAGRLPGHNLYYEARASWGRSSNEISPVGTYTDNFDTTRRLTSAKISGSFNYGEVTVRPHLQVSYFEETQQAYTDSLAVAIPRQTITLGELNFGPELTRTIKLASGATLTPKLGIAGIWNFATKNSNGNNPSAQGFDLDNGDIRARVDAGLSTTGANGWILSLLAYYDGIGIEQYEAYGGNVALTIPLN